jgi:hypothetical protein
VKDEVTFPEGISDRKADIWEALLAIADAAGGESGLNALEPPPNTSPLSPSPKPIPPTPICSPLFVTPLAMMTGLGPKS